MRTESDQGGVSCPTWVNEALAECAECQAGSVCTFMADLAAGCETAAATEGEAEDLPSVESELSGAGTSASESSVPDSEAEAETAAQMRAKLATQTLSALSNLLPASICSPPETHLHKPSPGFQMPA